MVMDSVGEGYWWTCQEEDGLSDGLAGNDSMVEVVMVDDGRCFETSFLESWSITSSVTKFPHVNTNIGTHCHCVIYPAYIFKYEGLVKP